MYKLYFKRYLDFIISLIVVLILLPFLLIIALCLLVIYKGKSPFYKEERVGKDNKIFTIIKFKSMTDEKDENGNLLPNDKRITPIGQFIRKTSLDELPQLINILKGDMAIIGPRPLQPRYLKLYSKEQIRRHDIRPGITGWAQVNGRNTISWTRKFELDLWYVKNVTFMLDVKIFFLTIKQVIVGKDINSSGMIGGEGFNGYN